MLPGIKSNIFSPSLTTLQFVTRLDSISLNTQLLVPNDGTVKVGDLLVWMNTTGGGSPAAYVTPSGFTALVQVNTTVYVTDVASTLCVKIVQASDLGTTFTGMDGGSAEDIACLVFRADYPITGFVAGTFNSNASASSMTVNIVTTGVTTPAVLIAAALGDTIRPSLSGTPALTEFNDVLINGGYKIYNLGATLESGTASTSDIGTQAVYAGYISVY